MCVCMNVQLCMGVVGEFMSTQVWLMSLHECELRSVDSGHLCMQLFVCNAHFKL